MLHLNFVFRCVLYMFTKNKRLCLHVRADINNGYLKMPIFHRFLVLHREASQHELDMFGKRKK